MHLAYRSTFSEGNKMNHCAAWECYYWSNYYDRKDKFERHKENCAGQPWIIYDFYIQNVVTFEDNIKYKGNITLIPYIDFETTAPTNSCLNRKQKNCLLFLTW